jgi:hypothetical protein
MSVRSTIALLLALSTLSLLVGCGSSSTKAVAPPGGGFSNSNLNGTYVFSTSGVDSTSGVFLTLVGDFVANGSGGITGGAFDFASVGTGVMSPNNAITGGSYRITVDGRGQATLNSSGGPVTLDFVLTSNSHGLVTEFDGSGTGSGTLDLQPAAPAQSAFGGLSYSFGFFGDSTSNVSFGTVGTFSLDASGNVTAGFEDANSGSSSLNLTAMPITSGTVLVGTGTAPGTAQLVTSGAGTLHFDVYVIDSTHLKFIETDATLFSSGDAFTQATSIPSGQLVFTMAGADTVNFAAPGAPIEMGGYLTNAGGIVTTGLEDVNDGGAPFQSTTVSGTIPALAGGRSVLTLNNFINGGLNGAPGTYAFAAYPFTSNGVTGFQLLEIDGAGITSGAAFVQTGTTLAGSQGYGLNLSALNSAGEEDDIAEFVTTSTGFSGLLDVNDVSDQGSLGFQQPLNGSYTAADSTGRGTFTTTNFFNGNFYVVDSSTFLILETDTSQVGLGVVELQGTPAASAAARSVVSALRPAARAHGAGAWRRIK